MADFPVAYAVYNKNEQIRFASTSGGIFSCIASYLINQKKAIVFGAAYDENFHIRHVAVDNVEDLAKLRGSKYAQSNLGDTFVKIKKLLQEGKVVFFSGTPCQVAGLKKYLKLDYRNLYCLDFICHGVASPETWNAYVEDLKNKGEIQNIIFKFKRRGWKKWYFRVEYVNGKTYQVRGSMNTFMRSYLSYCNIRPSCYACKFKGINHNADFTISDAWGVAERNSEINDNRGLSSLLLQNERAVELFTYIKDDLNYLHYDANELMSGNWTAFRSVPPHADREAFFALMGTQGGMYALNKFFKPTILSWGKYYFLRLMGKEK